MNDRDRQALRHGQGRCRTAAPLGRRTHIRMARTLPPSCQGLGQITRERHGMDADCLDTNAHGAHRKILDRQLTLEPGF